MNKLLNWFIEAMNTASIYVFLSFLFVCFVIIELSIPAVIVFTIVCIITNGWDQLINLLLLLPAAITTFSVYLVYDDFKNNNRRRM